MSIIFNKSVKNRRGLRPPEPDVPVVPELPVEYRRKEKAELCELSELDTVRHFTWLSRRNFGLDSGFYPLGSCTMKYNPKILERVAGLKGFSELHPFLPQLRQGAGLVQGALRVLYDLELLLAELSGMAEYTLQPMAGAHGELTGMMIIAAYHRKKGNNKTEVLIPDEAHGTNPSSASTAGFSAVSIPTDEKTGMLDIVALKEKISEKTAAVMLTNPNTLGIFNTHIKEVCEIAHQYDAQVYYDGANFNAVMGRFRPGDAGVDVVHVNLHKTFGTPHGSGGPGSGPVGVAEHLSDFLPISRIVKRSDNTYILNYDYPDSIGYIASFYGNFAVCLKACAYILLLGEEGLKEVSDHAVLNANYLMNQLRDSYDLPFEHTCKHEFVLSARRQQKEHGIRAVDIAKGLIDEGFHPPTVYFPLIVPEALMIEPTETESKETLDSFVEAMLRLAEKAASDPDALHAAPVTTPVGRPDEVKAARDMDLACLATAGEKRSD